MRSLSRAAHSALILSAAIVVTGCSARKVVYGHADLLIYREIDSTFDVDTKQKAFVQDRLRSMLAWHAREELPRYAQVMGELGARAVDADGLTRADVDWAYTRVEEARVRLVDRILPRAVEFLGTVKPEQIEDVESKNAKSNSKRTKRFALQGEEYVDERAEQVTGNFTPWIGSLTDAQKAYVRTFVVASRPLEEERFARSLSQQKAFVAMLRQQEGAPARERTLRAALRSLVPDTNPLQARYRDLVLQVAAVATSEQKMRFLREMHSWKADFEELHRKYGNAPTALDGKATTLGRLPHSPGGVTRGH